MWKGLILLLMRKTDIFLLRSKYNLQVNCAPHTHKAFNCFLFIASNLNSYDEKIH